MVLRWFRPVRRRFREASAGERGSGNVYVVRGTRGVWREQGLRFLGFGGCGCLVVEWGSSELGDSEMKVTNVEDF